MSELSGLERRITAALDRIAQAAQALSAPPPEAEGEAALRAALKAEKAKNAELSERVRAAKERQEAVVAQVEKKLARANEQLDVQGFELQRLKRANAQLAEANRKLIEAQTAGRPDQAAALRALQAELDSLRAARRSEIAELEEIMAELAPLVGAAPAGEAQHA